MSRCAHICLMADYNQWMNAKVYAAAASLPPEELRRERGAFFGSLLATLNHVMVGDILWLQRYAKHPAGFPLLDPIRAITPPPYRPWRSSTGGIRPSCRYGRSGSWCVLRSD